jgi:hypothetical protein
LSDKHESATVGGMSQTPSWEQFQPFIRQVVIAALQEKKGKLVSDYAMQQATLGSMMGGMIGSMVPEGVELPDSISAMIGGQAAGAQGAQKAILAAFDAAIARLESDGEM